MKSDNEKDDYSLEDIMTKGVEKASLIIVAVTRQYKLNPSTFAGNRWKFMLSNYKMCMAIIYLCEAN